MSYARLAADLGRLGVEESERSIEGKILRGTFRFSFFLQSLVASGADWPAHWESALRANEDWERRASMLMQSELDARPWISWAELSRRLAAIGEHVTPEALSTQVKSGAFPATLFLQCAVVCSFVGLELFVDQSDLHEAARRGSAA
ncbi:DUF6471 domain-containing protein [Paraburkholderia terrae]